MRSTRPVPNGDARRPALGGDHPLIERMTPLSRAGLAALLALTAACGSSRATTPTPLPTPAVPPEVEKPAPASAPRVAAPAPHPFAYGAGEYRYEIRSDAIITAEGTPRVDTVATRAIVTYRVSARDSGLLSIEGSVDSFTVTGSRGGSPPSAGLPFTMTVTADGHPAAPPSRDSAGVCTTPLEAVVATSRELIAAIPVALAVDVQWTDSLSAVTCRGTIPVTTRSERHSQASWVTVPVEWARHEGDAAFEITRTTTTSVAGEGRAAGRQVAVSGSGQGTGLLYVDPELGVLLGAVGNSSTRLIVDTGTQRQQFLQMVRQHISLLR